MSVLIKEMEMPGSCSECRFFVDAWCYAFEAEDWRNAYNKPPDGERLKDCPLEEPKTGAEIVPKEESDMYIAGYRDGHDDATKTARWIKGDDYVCDYCGYRMVVGSGVYNYCPSCGKRMLGEDGEEE